MFMRFLFLLFMMLLPADVVQAAGFDCRKARTADEVAVCTDPLLSELDEIMTVFYQRLRHYTRNFDNAMGLQARLRNEARAFLKRRVACGADAACLHRAYRARIRELLAHWQVAMEDEADAGEAGDAGDAVPAAAPDGFSCQRLMLSSLPLSREECPAAGEYPDMVESWVLGSGKVACAVPCFAGAYNVIYRAFLVDAASGRVERPLRFAIVNARGRIERQAEVVSPAFDERTKTLSSFNRGRGLGDCGEQYRWRWNGERFRLVEQRVKDACDGKRGPWRRVWPR